MKTSIIVAHDNNGLIGIDGKIPWNIAEDIQRFKKLTTGNAVVMGRKTFESLNSTPLPNRINIVLSKSYNHGIYFDNNIFKSDSLTIALVFLEYILGIKEAFIIGGENLYDEGMDYADTIYRTWINDVFDGNEKAYFKMFDKLDEFGFKSSNVISYQPTYMIEVLERYEKSN